jgi:hypothetical protein
MKNELLLHEYMGNKQYILGSTCSSVSVKRSAYHYTRDNKLRRTRGDCSSVARERQYSILMLFCVHRTDTFGFSSIVTRFGTYFKSIPLHYTVSKYYIIVLCRYTRPYMKFGYCRSFSPNERTMYNTCARVGDDPCDQNFRWKSLTVTTLGALRLRGRFMKRRKTDR